MITPAYSATATERVLPRLALDFTTASLDPRVSVSRALNTATAVNSSGLISVVNANLPRFDYTLGVAGACKGLLIEETRSNLAINSVFANTGGAAPTSWTQQIATGTSVPAASTFSTVGVAYSQTATAQRPFIAQSITLAASTTYAVTFVIESVTGATVYDVLGVQGLVPSAYILNGINVPLSTPAATGTLTIIVTTTTAGAYVLRCGLGVAGNVTGTIRFSCPQLEAGAFATSYIPTTTTSLTRNADVVTMTGANFSSWYSSGAGSFQINATPRVTTGTRPLLQADDTSSNNLIALRQNVADPELYVVSGGVTQAQIDAGTVTANTAYKLCGAWATDNCVVAKDGAAPLTDLSATIPTPVQLRIGSDGTNYGNIWVAKINYWSQRMSNNETQAFSK